MVDRVVTQLRCERTAMDTNYARGSLPIIMHGTAYVSPAGPKAPATELDAVADDKKRDPVDPPALASDAADAPEPETFQDVCCHRHHRPPQSTSEPRTLPVAAERSLMLRRAACCG